jgi:NTP pyrophosphatase (non-canonical NTP hydrolase)
LDHLIHARRATYSVDDYADDIWKIWETDRDRPIWLSWLFVIKHASEVCEELRKNRWNRVAENLAEVVVWWLSFAKRVTTKPNAAKKKAEDILFYINSTPSTIIWMKYPNLCPACFSRYIWKEYKSNGWQEREDGTYINKETKDLSVYLAECLKDINNHFDYNRICTCLAAKDEVEDRNKNPEFKKFAKASVYQYAKLMLNSKPTSMVDISIMLNNIFKNNVAVLSAEEIAFHLLEEVGEVSTAITGLFMQPTDEPLIKKERRERVAEFAEELADVYSWSISLLAKIHRFINCASDLVSDLTRTRGLLELVKGTLDITNNVVELIWAIYDQDKSGLKCEKCKQRPCNSEAPAHKGKHGCLSGNISDNSKRTSLLEASEY